MAKCEAVLQKFIYNDNIYDVEKFNVIYLDINPSAYEVIRILNGIPLFLEEHYNRLITSIKLLGYNVNISLQTIRSTINKMSEVNNAENYNIKIIINNFQNQGTNIFYYFIKSEYPNPMQYVYGIDTITYKATRNNPNAKVIYKSMREEIDAYLKEANCYEALLVNDRNEVTEGSRSNLFLIKNNEVYTAPPKDVLLGITRERILSLCMRNSIKVIEKPIGIGEIYKYDAGFISGTSPKVLPINKVDSDFFNCNNFLLKEIMNLYDMEIENYIKNNTNK